ncbi:AAA domain-containing protein [Micromonospora rifamycinica]|uniref:AAA domain-containing protein n=1 Tax=Micromonospora rifamycinica TaxID=291594 RepID=UPI003435AFA6
MATHRRGRPGNATERRRGALAYQACGGLGDPSQLEPITTLPIHTDQAIRSEQAVGRQLDRILATLAELDFDMSEVMVIGPFRDVAREVGRRARRYRGLVAGTVHTAQGKQADVVVLVLGGAPDRVGARHWASSRPNLLNVAVSRAKRRLYVIGDRRAWSPLRYFDILATELPSQEPMER